MWRLLKTLLNKGRSIRRVYGVVTGLAAGGATVETGACAWAGSALRRLTISADIFNVFNANNLSGFANAASTSNQVQFGGGVPFVQRNAGPPRQFQFGASWAF